MHHHDGHRRRCRCHKEGDDYLIMKEKGNDADERRVGKRMCNNYFVFLLLLFSFVLLVVKGDEGSTVSQSEPPELESIALSQSSVVAQQ